MDAKEGRRVRTPEEIANLANHRKSTCGTEQSRMDEIRRLYNGEMEVNLPELQENEKAVAANLAQLGIDQMAMRVASVTPAVSFPIARIDSSTAKNAARLKRDIILHDWWANSRVTTHVMPRRARWFFSFAVAPVLIRPGMDGRPMWYDRHPIGTYTSPMAKIGDIVPNDAVFVFKRPGAELMREYPSQMHRICGNGALLDRYDIVEYVDADQITCIVMGQESSSYMQANGTPYEVLHSMPNRAERPLVVTPGRITLDRPLGQFDGLIGSYQLQARLMALYTIAQERAIFPETWLVSQPGMPRAEVLVAADPKEGIVGEVVGGNLQKIDMSPSPITANLIDRLEYIERASGAVPAEFSGHSSSNVRTGRRGDAVMSAAVDYRLQEAQTIFESSLEEENKIAIAVAKAYAGGRKFSFYAPGRGKLTYSAKDFDDDTNEVRYAYAGADANSLTIAVGQKLGLETLSRETAMELDPLVRDVETEKDRIVAESVQRAFLSSIQTLAADPNAPWQPADFARFGSLVETNRKNIYEAAEQVNKEVQERQAAQAAGQMQGAEAMPGLAQPGAPGAPVPPEAVGDIGPSVGNLSEMLTQLRRPQMRIAGEGAPIGQPVMA